MEMCVRRTIIFIGGKLKHSCMTFISAQRYSHRSMMKKKKKKDVETSKWRTIYSRKEEKLRTDIDVIILNRSNEMSKIERPMKKKIIVIIIIFTNWKRQKNTFFTSMNIKDQWTNFFFINRKKVSLDLLDGQYWNEMSRRNLSSIFNFHFLIKSNIRSLFKSINRSFFCSKDQHFHSMYLQHLQVRISRDQRRIFHNAKLIDRKENSMRKFNVSLGLIWSTHMSKSKFYWRSIVSIDQNEKHVQISWS